MNKHTQAGRYMRHERHVLAAVGTGGSLPEVVGRVSYRLTPGERDAALRRLEAGGAVRRDDAGNYSRDIQAWSSMRRGRK
ncbi:hypothetical protein GCM10027408_20360 [Microbacterium tumbae]